MLQVEARALIEARRYVVKSDWGEVQPRAADENRFLVYQADTTGDYRASDPDDERTARLRALVTTDAGGHFVLRTILPGVYGDPPGDPHLHIEVSAAQPAMHSVYFAGFAQASTVRWTETTEQGHIAPTTRGDDGALGARLVLPVRGVAR